MAGLLFCMETRVSARLEEIVVIDRALALACNAICPLGAMGVFDFVDGRVLIGSRGRVGEQIPEGLQRSVDNGGGAVGFSMVVLLWLVDGF